MKDAVTHLRLRTPRRRARIISAARVGPVVYGLLLTFRGDGYG